MTRLLIRGGHLVDPANLQDGRADLLVEDGQVAEVGREIAAPRGCQVLDASGLLVLPGLVDSHTHLAAGRWQGHAMMARVGVTTALNLSDPITEVLDGVRAAGAGLTIASLESPTPRELGGTAPSAATIDGAIERAVEAGALGVKILGGHHPFTPDATAEIVRQANRRGAYVALHVGTTEHGSNLNGLRQAVALAEGCALHVAHVNSYCRGLVADPIDEAREAIALLATNPRLRSESYLALLNGTPGYCEDGAPASLVTRTCLRTGGFEPTEQGLERAILAGWAKVNDQLGDEISLLDGESGRELWRELDTRVELCFEINNPISQFILATARRHDGSFAIDALSTDGGGIPRNETVARGLALVAFGGLSLSDFVRKACWAPARLIGLDGKGHLGRGADADLALIHQPTRRVKATLAAGRPIMLDGVVLGSGGTIVTTAAGQRALRSAGLPTVQIDLQRSALYQLAALDR